jgi:hypothetical protein
MCCWPLPMQSFSGPSPLVLETIFYCLTFETSLFVASYDSQGHGGGIRPLLHTGINLVFNCQRIMSRDSAVGIAPGYGLEDGGGRSSSPGMFKNFLFSTSSRPALGPTQPPIQWVMGALSPGVKRPGREADHSPPTSSEIKNTWIYTFTLPYIFVA